MGYVAYAAGTLIAAVAIHSFYTRRLKTNTEENSDGNISISASPPITLDSSQNENEIAHGPAAPSIDIETPEDQDDYERKNDTFSLSVRSASPEHGSHGPQSKADLTPAKYAHETEPPKLQVKEMSSPPRPSSAPNLNTPAAQARQRAAMPPPSSLPPSRGRSPPRLKPATSSLVPPPRPSQARGGLPKPTGLGSGLAPPPLAASSLRVPQQRVLANTRMQPSLAPSTSTQPPSKRASKKVMLAPGHSPLDWAALTRSTSPTAPNKLRGNDATGHLGPFRMGRITPSQLKYQNGRKGKDAWTVYQGKVYNISAYLDFHPGGGDELMKGAGRSSDSLFAEVHPWVNWDGMLQGCMIGMLVGEDDPVAASRKEEKESENELDEMD